MLTFIDVSYDLQVAVFRLPSLLRSRAKAGNNVGYNFGDGKAFDGTRQASGASCTLCFSLTSVCKTIR